MKRLNIIGCGKLGQSLARLWSDADILIIGSIVNQSMESSRMAVERIGSGKACGTISSCTPAEFWLIASNDASIAPLADSLSKSGLLRSGDCVFHCSGSLTSFALASCAEVGALTSSIHPVMSFAKPLSANSEFSGTFCGCEGADEALQLLRPYFQQIGGRCFDIKSEEKPLYHAATVMCCNYLTALTETSAELFTQAGLQRETALQLMQPIMQATLSNIFLQGTTAALTGPIARGDTKTVAQHLEAIREPNTSAIYKALGIAALKLSKQQESASPDTLAEIEQLLSS